MRALAVPLLLLALAGCGSQQAGEPGDGYSYAPPERADAPLCPERFEVGGEEPWVPEPPTTETAGRLVPDADPVSAGVCRYTPEGELEGEVELVSGLERIRHDLLVPEKLDGQSRACTLIGGTPVPQLMLLSYADGELWISATEEPNSCTDSSNGDFTTATHLGWQLSRSYEAAAWVPFSEPEGCTGDGRGRLGQEKVLAPSGFVSLRVCRPPGSGLEGPREVDPGTAEQVAELLSEVATEPGSGGCAGTIRTSYELLFTWTDGPPVHVSYLPGCEPAIRNGSLDGAPTAEQGARLEDLLRAP